MSRSSTAFVRWIGRPVLVGLSAALAAAILAGVVVLRSEAEARHVRRVQVADVAGDKGHEIESAVEHGLAATYALAALVRQGRGAVPNFEAVATEMLRFYPGADALQLAPGGVIRHVVPLAENARAIGHDLLADPLRTKEAFLARDTGRLTLAGPFNLIQGGVGAVGRLPVFLDGEDGGQRFWGFTTVLIRFPSVLQKAQLPLLVKRGFHYQLWRIHPDTGERQVIDASSDAPLRDPVDRSLSMPNGTWTLSIEPVDGWGGRESLAPKMLLAALFSALIGWLAWQMSELSIHRRRLEVMVSERTASLVERESKLAALIDSLPDMLFVLDVDGRIVECHAPDPGLLFSAPSEFLGRTFREVLPSDVAGRIERCLRVVAEGGKRGEVEYSLDLPGGVRQFSASINCLAGGQGPLAGYISLVRDVTKAKMAEERMREAMVVFDASSQGIMTANARAVITSVNPAFCAITGYAADEAVGQTPSIFKSGRHDPSFYENIWRTLGATGRWEGEIWNRRKSGEVYPQWLSISAVRDEAGEVVKYVSIFSDITRRKQREELIWRQANFDALTGLANRNLLHDRLERAFAHARRATLRVGLIFLDLDGFKWINDTLGHDVGDEMLTEVAARLRACVREQDTVGRLGGDEFTLIAEEIADADALQSVAEKVLASLREPFFLAGANRYISGSLGITVYPDDGDSVQALLRNADIAMYQAKQLGKNRCQFYAKNMQEAARARVQLEAELRQAIASEQFELHYQPIVEASSGRIVGAEALIRWRHPERGLVSPADFIPVAEETGLIVPVGEWVLNEAARQSVAWRSQGLPALRLSVNVSGVQFREAGLLEQLRASMQSQQGMELLLEITESVLMQGNEVTERRLREISALGLGYALDDFGTGYSSLSYLKRFPVNVVKIDRSFVRDCPQDRNDSRLVEAIINMAHSLDLKVTAEGVETVEQRDFLCERGCDYLQGYLISRPVPAAVFAEFVLASAHAEAGK